MDKMTEEYIYENYLEEGESILWSQLPEKKRLYLKDSISTLILLALTVCIFLLPVYVVLIFLRAAWLIMPLIGFALAVVVILLLGKTSTFAVTDKRVLIFKDFTFKELKYDVIRYVETKRRKNKDIGNIRLFTKIRGSEPINGSSDGIDVRFLELYGVEDVGRVTALIKDQMLSKNSYKKAYEKAREAERMQGYRF